MTEAESTARRERGRRSGKRAMSERDLREYSSVGTKAECKKVDHSRCWKKMFGRENEDEK